MNTFKKKHSFSDFYTRLGASIASQKARLIKVLADESTLKSTEPAYAGVLKSVNAHLGQVGNCIESSFFVTQMIADELSLLHDRDLARYAYHRYRYDVYPLEHTRDAYPPYIQIEPTPDCNYRCVFCYQSNKYFERVEGWQRREMCFDIFKGIIDDVQGNIEFGSISSRGEPLLCTDIGRMLEYCSGKFLGLKLNTNASLLTEKLCHSILSENVRTVVFSVDAHNSESYGRLRKGGTFERVMSNVKMFETTRRRHYSHVPIISRISGVLYDEASQDIHEMIRIWSELADQVVFVKYNPWECVYEKAPVMLDKPCSDLWRRMFIWYDGTVNPCDVDFRSTLSIGNVQEERISEIWRSSAYDAVRVAHMGRGRGALEPCSRCVVI